MTVPAVNLTGPGATGVVGEAQLKGVPLKATSLPTQVKLGARLAPIPEDCPRFAAHFQPPSGWAPPASVDYTGKATASVSQMLGNDQYGDCVIAGKGHSVGIWTANDSDSGGEVIATTQEAVQAYHRICGPGDNGCVIQEVLREMRANGITFGGRPHRLGGWVAVDHAKPELVKAAVHLFGAVTIGFNFPTDWSGRSVWDKTNSRNVGGHDVAIVRYDARGVYVASWGRIYLMTWAALAQPGRVEECYALLSPDWTGNDKLSPAGVDVDALASALEALGQGDMPDPKPPAPPTPPTPPTPTPVQFPAFTLTGSTDEEGQFHGRAVPEGAVAEPDRPDPSTTESYAIELGSEVAAYWLAGWLRAVLMVHAEVEGGKLTVRRGKLTPEQWAAIIQLAVQVAAAIGAILAGH